MPVELVQSDLLSAQFVQNHEDFLEKWREVLSENTRGDIKQSGAVVLMNAGTDVINQPEFLADPLGEATAEAVRENAAQKLIARGFGASCSLT